MKFLVSFFMCITAFFATAQDQVVQSNINGLLGYNQGQIAALAQEFSEDQYDWRPSEGVRSVRETILHLASANYYIASGLGFTTPEDVDMQAIEQITGKENVIAALNKSFEFVKEKLGQIPSSDFEKEVDLGFMKTSTLSGMLIILDHSGEHKGQLIAYARSNGVVPPWSK
ncbi:MAG TPA: DinB family protein [Flavobacteriaceae bacterium]|jgi:uncharacterized damage-inducible protein DinB